MPAPSSDKGGDLATGRAYGPKIKATNKCLTIWIYGNSELSKVNNYQKYFSFISINYTIGSAEPLQRKRLNGRKLCKSRSIT